MHFPLRTRFTVLAFVALGLGSIVGAWAQTTNADVRAPMDWSPWVHSGQVWILTTPEGADLPAGAVVKDFPILVRLNRDFFPFTEAAADGADVRFATAEGQPLPYQIEQWDSVHGEASVWVRVPMIRGNDQQAIRIHWGRTGVVSESSGSAVFGASNGFAAVHHMNGESKDETGALAVRDSGTVLVAGVAGGARHFEGGKGITAGEDITTLPSGSSPHTTAAWFRTTRPNTTVVGWGNEQAQGKVVMQFRSPPHVSMDCYFSDGNVRSQSALAVGEWTHVVHTYEVGKATLYVNGVRDGVVSGRSAPLKIRRPARLYIGGWYDNYDFAGDIDEVRISNGVRPEEWVRLEYANLKPLHTLVGPVVRAGNSFAATPAKAELAEGTWGTFATEAAGARKLYWLQRRGGREQVVAVDRREYTLPAGRVAGDESFTLVLKAVVPEGIKTQEIPVTVREAIPDPEFKLKGPSTWDGRTPIDVEVELANGEAAQAAPAGPFAYRWNAGQLGTTREALPGKLRLLRAHHSGQLNVSATLDNGGTPVTRSAAIEVTEPATDAWVERPSGSSEWPEDNQFIPRGSGDEGTLHITGKLNESATAVFVRALADGQLYRTGTIAPSPDGSYRLALGLKAGLVHYSVSVGVRTSEGERILHTATNVVCGDAFLIQGQSNAVSTDWGEGKPTFHSEWIRTFGTMSGEERGLHLWGEAVHRAAEGEALQIGYWGMELARRLLESQRIPICILNGAVGGTRIDQHQRNPDRPEDLSTIYGRLLWRVREARLTHGIRAVFWHQGENDQGADGPTGRYGWETYRPYFIDLAGAWKQDFPNLQRMYAFQIWPKSCAMGVDGSDNRLREVQRTLPKAFSRLTVLSTLGIEPPGGCHYPAAGYAEFARMLQPLVERDLYHRAIEGPLTPPNLRRAAYADNRHDRLVLDFDQPVAWSDSLKGEFQLDGVRGGVVGGVAEGNRLTLALSSPSQAGRVSYLDSQNWRQDRLLRGTNGMAALTFCDVPID